MKSRSEKKPRTPITLEAQTLSHGRRRLRSIFTSVAMVTVTIPLFAYIGFAFYLNGKSVDGYTKYDHFQSLSKRVCGFLYGFAITDVVACHYFSNSLCDCSRMEYTEVCGVESRTWNDFRANWASYGKSSCGYDHCDTDINRGIERPCHYSAHHLDSIAIRKPVISRATFHSKQNNIHTIPNGLFQHRFHTRIHSTR